MGGEEGFLDPKKNYEKKEVNRGGIQRALSSNKPKKPEREQSAAVVSNTLQALLGGSECILSSHRGGKILRAER